MFLTKRKYFYFLFVFLKIIEFIFIDKKQLWLCSFYEIFHFCFMQVIIDRNNYYVCKNLCISDRTFFVLCSYEISKTRTVWISVCSNRKHLRKSRPFCIKEF